MEDTQKITLKCINTWRLRMVFKTYRCLRDYKSLQNFQDCGAHQYEDSKRAASKRKVLIWLVQQILRTTITRYSIFVRMFMFVMNMPLMQRHPVFFGQTFCYIREEDCLFYLKRTRSHSTLFLSTLNFD